VHLFRFEIIANKFILQIHYGHTEEGGIKWCKEYMTRFQRQVANIQLQVAILAKEKQRNNWDYNGQPYIYQKTLIRKPLTKRATEGLSGE
jgi:hypothetical protein